MHFDVGILLISLPYVYSAVPLHGQIHREAVHLNTTMEEYQPPRMVSATHSQEVQAGRSAGGKSNLSIEHREPAASPEAEPFCRWGCFR
ncbi:hypothetical protein Moror_3082 [Moniliophthora roreri MCA 2997]|uniref:Secreted protein n=2 Tax=Moniliophthora roreri TaxID=221103 RepID=V2WP89_MONRO|nr:hypothetical protein Moror_3082 [Moniliophthora roreri MCA 2997]KAI3605878.1 hypothetical protein WG66_012364 [Moniliophthora roreri]